MSELLLLELAKSSEKFDNVAKVSFDISDSNWAAVDSDEYAGELIQGHKIPLKASDKNRKMSIVPSSFKVGIGNSYEIPNIVFSPNNNNNIQYLAIKKDDDDELLANRYFFKVPRLKIKAIGAAGTTLTNYSDNTGFAKNVNINASGLNNLLPSDVRDKVSLHAYAENFNKYNRGYKRVNADLDFVNGEATIDEIKMILAKGNSPVNPFSINTQNISLSVRDTDGISGNTGMGDREVKYRYARIVSDDFYVTTNSNIDAKLYYEFYCNSDINSECSSETMSPSSSSNVNWKLTTDIVGNFKSRDKITFSNGSVSVNSFGQINNGVQNIVFRKNSKFFGRTKASIDLGSYKRVSDFRGFSSNGDINDLININLRFNSGTTDKDITNTFKTKSHKIKLRNRISR